jgi:spermidine synthase
MIDRLVAPDGTELALYHRDGVYTLRADGRELMDSRHHWTEQEMARLACHRLPSSMSPRVLIGGLGMGFTVRAALDGLPDRAEIVVAEVFAAIVAWNEGPLAHLAGAPLADPRVNVVEADVCDVLRQAHGEYDAVLLDVDNGPHDLVLATNRELYTVDGLRRTRRALKSGGVLAVWSAAQVPDLVVRLRDAGYVTRTETIAARPGDSRVRHTIVMSTREG